MVQMIKNNVIPSELEQTKLTLIMKDTFSIRWVKNWTRILRWLILLLQFIYIILGIGERWIKKTSRWESAPSNSSISKKAKDLYPKFCVF